jgi:photosystem II stability/assembly factor-like uncharacterized protein
LKFKRLAIACSVSLLLISLLTTGCESSKPNSNLASQVLNTFPITSTGANPTASPSPTSQQTTFAAPRVDTNVDLVTSAILWKTDGWFVYLNNGKVEVYHSTDSGKTWTQGTLPTKGWEQNVQKQNIYTSWHIAQEGPSWILLTSDPAAGQMLKTLYHTTDNGKTWTLLSDVSFKIIGYVTGMTFRDKTYGWIAASSHSSILLPLYRTTNGGKTWEIQSIAIPKDYKYGNPQAPVFDSTQPDKGTLQIEFVNDNKTEIFNYTTIDGGETWEEKK